MLTATYIVLLKVLHKKDKRRAQALAHRLLAAVPVEHKENKYRSYQSLAPCNIFGANTYTGPLMPPHLIAVPTERAT